MAKKHSVVSHRENASQNHNEIHLTGISLAIEENAGESVETRKPCALLVGASHGAATVGECGASSEAEPRITTPTAVPLLGMCPEEPPAGTQTATSPCPQQHHSNVCHGRMEG